MYKCTEIKVNYYVEEEMPRSREREKDTPTHTFTIRNTYTHLLTQTGAEKRLGLAFVQILVLSYLEYYYLMTFELIIADLFLIFSYIEFVVYLMILTLLHIDDRSYSLSFN